MTSADLLQRFARVAPVSVMISGLIDHIFSAAFLNGVAEAARQASYTRDIEFAHLVALLTEVVFEVHPSVRAAYRHQDALQAVASLKCFYEKLNRTEPAVGAALVAAVADRTAALLPKAPHAQPLRGLRLLTLDGNHLAATQRRLDGLEAVPAPLPGQALVLRDYARGLFLRVLPWEDAHTNERALHADVRDWFTTGDCVVADSSFCSAPFLRGLHQRQAFFVVRHHGSVGLTPLGPARRRGRSSSGALTEQRVRYAQTDLELRLITVALDRPTRDGQTEVRVLTDLSSRQCPARQVAELYLGRRAIETAFQELEAALRSEVNTLAYPRAALLAFCLAVSLYNLLQVVRGTLAPVCQARRLQVQDLSATLLAQEVRAHLAGVRLALRAAAGWPTAAWGAEQMQAWLHEQSKFLRPERYVKSKRGPKKPRALDDKVRRDHHGATARILTSRGERSPAP